MTDTATHKILRVTPDERIATVARTFVGADLAVLPDGGFLISGADADRVRRVGPNGVITAFAGTGHDGFSGDGGPATRAAIASPQGLAVQDDGNVLIADLSNNRVRRVTPDGRIGTVAGTGAETDSGDGGPATRAGLSFPVALAALPDGGFLIGGRSLRTVSPSGTISTLLPSGTQDFAGRHVSIGALAVLPDASIAFVSDHEVWMLASPQAQRLAVALTGLSVSARSVRATISTTRPATATLEIRRNGQPVASSRQPVAAGTDALDVGGRFASRLYEVEVRVDDPDGRVASDQVDALLGSTLRMADATAVIDLGTGDESGGRYLKGCRRRGPRNVFCQVTMSSTTSHRIRSARSATRASASTLSPGPARGFPP